MVAAMHELKLQITNCSASLEMDALHAPVSVVQIQVWSAALTLTLSRLHRQAVLFTLDCMLNSALHNMVEYGMA